MWTSIKKANSEKLALVNFKNYYLKKEYNLIIIETTENGIRKNTNE